MDQEAKKTALRMIPYGIYVLTASDRTGNIAAATVNWVTQTAFAPPLVVVGVKADSGAYATLKAAGHFALNMLGKGQQGLAFAFFKPAEAGDGTISGEPYRTADTGAPILVNAQASVECRVAEIVERGDHHIVIGEVVAAHVASPPAGRPDAAILEMKDLGEKVFYGG
jgi:flavin reductase (DIM6/NTAB) family NADH-FMN oxidoreductase RutF